MLKKKKVAPREPEEQKEYHGTIRDMITASSYMLSLSPKGDTHMALGIWRWANFCFRTNKRHHQQQLIKAREQVLLV